MQVKSLFAICIFAVSFLAAAQALAAEEFLVCSPPSAELQEFSASLSHTLGALNGGSGSQIKLLVEELEEPNAFALREFNTILVSTKLYPLIQSSAEEAFLVAHELGHLASSHTTAWAPLVGSVTNNDEQAADRYALRKLHEINLDTRAGEQLINRLKSINNSSNRTYSLLHQHRIKALKQETAQLTATTAAD
jgi:predicted Zn-dependent protease